MYTLYCLKELIKIVKSRTGKIRWISGSVVVGSGIKDIEMGEIVEVGKDRLIGEAIRVGSEEFTAQLYENATGVKPGEEIIGSGKRLVAELGVGLINNIIDGVGRPLDKIMEQTGAFITRGAKVNTLSREKKWHFKPAMNKNDVVGPGDVIGAVQEMPLLTHKIMVPPRIRGKLTQIKEGEYTVEDAVATIESDGQKVDLKLMQEWSIRIPRPFAPGGRLSLDDPLVTGQRVIDTFFPLPRGGTASIPGGFGTGKTVMLHQLAKWCAAQVIVYVGCGERGNEMCEVLSDFPELIDPRTKRPLMERTILIANTSNMPVAAREASIYLGVTIAEYYRDQGYDVALMADSTSRWAEALREISGRLEEMPAEGGYPAYLPDRVAEFYERAGRTKSLGKPEREGSVSIIGAVSPPGGDFNEPVTIHTLRFTGVFWALDRDLAYSRHFPAIHWLKSYSLYVDRLLGSRATSHSQYADKITNYWEEALHEDFGKLRGRALKILSESAEIESIARIMGESALPDDQRLILLESELIKEAFLRQFAFHEVDAFCEMDRQVALLHTLLNFYDKTSNLVDNGVPAERIKSLPQISKLERAKEDKSGIKGLQTLSEEIDVEIGKLKEEYGIA
ncbi:V-type ATP synthase subunit A [Candidatus Bathyarchaeota archaeon]|jgi:V/A-type H+-transporting ATPase subunit A|nr:V-type ATP synthase subunit A [Candidatus Bathyarchaeota archaeon]